MVEVCFPCSGVVPKDIIGQKFMSYIERMSKDLPETVFIGYTRGLSTDLSQLLTDELQSHPQRLIQDRNTLGRLGDVVADHYGSLNYVPTRVQNGERIRHGRDAQRFKPYHQRVAEARDGSARAGTSSMPRGAPGTSGARVGGLDAGAENVGEGALDKWFRDLGIFS